MKKLFIPLLILLTGTASAKSLWNNGFSFYKIVAKEGDIVTVKFSEKTLMNYKVEQKRSDFSAVSGKKGSGEVFSFFPNAEVNQNDNVKNQNGLTVNNQSQFQIPARVEKAEAGNITLNGNNSVLINGETFKVLFTGQMDMNSFQSDGSVLSTDIYNLDFQVSQEMPKSADYFRDSDLVFATNYSDIHTNLVTDPTNNTITNTVIETNMESFKLEFKGIQDDKKKSLLSNYLNAIIQALFR